MNKYLKLIFGSAIMLSVSLPAYAASLDELYREIIRDDNQGYLPIFVKNRNQPELLFEDELEAVMPQPAGIKKNQTISLIDERQIKEQERLAAIKKWEDTVRAVKENRVTPVELEEINKHVADNDARAVEILAWMNARGVGVRQNLIEAFNLYRHAAELSVPGANKNAALVYRSMSRLQRESLSELTR